MYDLKQEARMLEECVEWANDKLDVGFTEKVNAILTDNISKMSYLQDAYDYFSQVQAVFQEEMDMLNEWLDRAKQLDTVGIETLIEDITSYDMSQVQDLNDELEELIDAEDSEDDDQQQKVLSLRLGR